MSGEHFVPETVGQIPVLLSELAKAVLRNPVVPASDCQRMKREVYEVWGCEKGEARA